MLLLPFFCFFFCLLWLVRRDFALRTAFLLAAVIWGCLVAAFIEVLGYFHLLTPGGLAGCWAFATAVVLLLHVQLEKPWPVAGRYPFSAAETGLAGGVLLICAATFATAIIAPPNTWDSMTYHMSRVMHWLQNRSVDHYPTHILRQLELNPWAEYAITNLQALSGGDRFANLVQWFSMLGSLVGVSLIAEQLGGSRRAQMMAVVVTATIPMGILQASSTQNDYVVAFWLVCLAWAGLQFMRGRELKWAVVVGTSLGLAVLSKGTAYLYAFPFALWIACVLLRGVPRQAALALLCIVLPFILLNAPHYQRNLQVFANPLSSGEDRYFNEELSAGTLLSNLVRNTALQLSSPSDSLNRLLNEGVASSHRLLQIDLNDPKTTWPDTQFGVNRLTRHEDSSGNFLHVLVACAVLATLAISRRFRPDGKPVLFYTLAVASGFFLFCLLLKWQPWHSRLLLPLFVLGAPVVGIVAVRCWQPVVAATLALTLLLAAIPWAFSNNTRPLVQISEERGMTFPLLTADRNALYFANRGDLYPRYAKIAEEVRRSNVTSLGLIMATRDVWEYPLWVLIGQGQPMPVRIEHIAVTNASRATATGAFRPEAQVRLD